MSGIFTGVGRLFQTRVRGFRVVDMAALALLLVLVTGVYAFKAAAGQEGGQLKDLDQKIAAETRAIRLARADVAALERPERLERFSIAYLGLQAQNPRREAEVDRLPALIAPVAPTHPVEAPR